MLFRNVVLAAFAASLLVPFPAVVSAHTDGGIVIKDAWVREAPPVAKVLAAYMVIENHTNKEKVLTGVTSSSFDRIEIHRSIHKDGMATMEQQKQLTIPAEGNVTLQPGEFHLMLFNPSKVLKAGSEVSFTLKFANGSTSMLTARVKKAMGSEHHEHGSHDNGGSHDMHDVNKHHNH